ncbi:hypothetical protein [uncultured Nostoc sp.]|uniref:hypothetical protein n=1 Tax=uncultured Nostoc sp. TaxID=340711 RepID=UPI002607960D|nr:hypothetical protein [uncultured Nostoc sp.]
MEYSSSYTLKCHTTDFRRLETVDLRSHQAPNPGDRNYGKVNVSELSKITMIHKKLPSGMKGVKSY